MFLAEFLFVARARMRETDVQFPAPLAGCDGDTSEAGCFVPFFHLGIFLADKRVVWGRVTFDKFAGTVILALVVEVTVD
jgi:hypothetical protein